MSKPGKSPRKDIIRRLEALEKHSHEPFDFSHLVERLETVETALNIKPGQRK